MIQEKRFPTSWLMVAGVVCIGLSAGCSSGDESSGGMDTGADTTTAAPVEAPTPAPQDRTATPTSTMVADHLNKADELVTVDRLPEARLQVLEALTLDPTNGVARGKLVEIQGRMGESTAPQDVVDLQIQHKQAMRQKKVVEVNDRFVQAQNLYNGGDYREALVQLELADLTMRFDAHDTDFGERRTDVSALMAQVNSALHADEARQEAIEYREAYAALKTEEAKELARRNEKINTLMGEAIESFERRDFTSTEKLCDKILYLAPTLRRPAELKEMAQRHQSADWQRRFFENRREKLQTWKEDVRAAQIPHAGILSWASREHWDDITARRSAPRSAGAAADESSRVREIRQILENTRVSFEFEDKTVAEAVQHFRDTQNINIQMSKTAMEEKGEEVVSLTANDMTFASALNVLLGSVELTYTFKYDMVWVAGAAESAGDVVPLVYEVRDLTISLANFKGPDLALRPGPAGEVAQEAIWGTEEEPVQDTEPESLVELLRDNVAPATWEIDGRVLEINQNQIIAVTTPDVHRQIRDFLEDLRRFTKVIVHVETRFISIKEGFLQEFGTDLRGLGGNNPGTLATLDDVTNGQINNASGGIDNNGAGVASNASLNPFTGLFFNDNNEFDYRARSENIFNRALGSMLTDTGGLTFGLTFLDDLEIGALFRAVEKSSFATMLTAPRLTIYNNQRANLTIVNQVAYVKDYDVEVAQTAFIADPLIDIVQDGMVLDVRPTVSHDRKYVTLEVRPTIATLQRPIGTFVTALGGLTGSVIIELPEIEYRGMAATVKVPDNGYLVIGGLKDVSTVDRRSETPILSQIPILNFFFSKKGRSDEISDLMIVLHVQIVDLAEEEADLTR